tara:strand:- start:17456 stop:18442 length:987 start_codon:yes stop_codon:yes gene_type:complete
MSVLTAGSPGIGKTSIIKQIAFSQGMDVIFLHPQYADHGEVAGVTWVWVSPDGQEMKADRVPLANMAPLFEATKPTLVIIDDLGHCMQSIQNSFMQLIEERRIGLRQVSDHVVFAASTNRKEDNAGAKTITSTMSNRFYTSITLDPSMPDLVEHAQCEGWEETMAPFINFCHSKDDPLFQPPTRDGSPFCTPRSLDKLQQMESAFSIEGSECPYEVVLGTVGQAMGDKYVAFRKIKKEIAHLPELAYSDPHGCEVPERPDLQYAMAGAVAMRATMATADAFFTYMARFPNEMEVVAVMDATRRDNTLKNTTPYRNWVVANQKWILEDD